MKYETSYATTIYGLQLEMNTKNPLESNQISLLNFIPDVNFIHFLPRLFDLGCYGDFLFKIQEETVLTHRFILAARSPYFREAFQGRWSSRRSAKLDSKLVCDKTGKLIPESWF